MVKETASTQLAKTDKIKSNIVNQKKKLTKRSVKSEIVKVPKVVKEKVVNEKVVKEKVVKEKAVKEKVEKVVTNRKINSKPVLAKTTGINISPAKVKNIVSNFVLNKDAYTTIKELKNAMPRQITKTVDGKESVEDFKGIPVAQLSKKSLDYIAYATECFKKVQMEEYVKIKVSKMPEPQHKTYLANKAIEKEKFDKDEKNKFLYNNKTFDSELFNRNYDVKFYDDYNNQKKLSNEKNTDNEWKKAIDKVTKLKNRFSTNSRVFLSALVEYLIKQIATNGTICCVADNKKIIQLSHILDTSKPGFAERFSLYPLIVNLDTFKQAQSYLQKQESQKTADVAVVESTDDTDDTDDTVVVKVDKNTDIFTLDGLTLDKQYQFRYYIGESCREIRMDLSTETSDDGKDNTVYNYTSVSKIFKNFCSTLVCEFLMRIGQMLEKEIDTRGIKTVNDIVIGTVISHYHIVCGVDENPTFDFIRSATSKYYSYVTNRQESRKNAKTTESGDLAYVTDK
jgi:hypothetical protein